MSTDRTCAHGLPWRSTKVWNENCVKCEAMAELAQSTLNQAHHGSKDMTAERTVAAIQRRQRAAQDAVRLWRGRRHRGIEWRAKAVERALASPPRYEPAVAAILQTDGDAFTAKQHEVLEMIYGRALSQREAATVLGISRAALRERLDSVNHKLRKLGVPTSGGQGRSNMELRRVVGWDFEGPPPATLLREGDLRI